MMHKICRISFCFRIFFQLLFVAVPTLQIVGWMRAPSALSFLQNNIVFQVIPKTYHVLHTLSMTERLLGFLVSLIPTVVTMSILYCLIKLFRLYEREEIFSLANVAYIKKIAYTLLVGQLLNPVYYFLMGITLTWRNPHGHRYAAVVLDQTNIAVVIIAFLTILIAWIMAEGCLLREEQRLTI